MRGSGQIGRGLGAAAVVALLAASAPLTAQPSSLDDWVAARSAHFEIASDAGGERAAEILSSLERFRDTFARLAPDLELRSPAPTRIFAFRDADSYAPYKTEGDGQGVRILGQFLTHRDGNYITLNADPRYFGSLPIVYHEYVHFLVQHNFPGIPRWFNEGLAEYYSTFSVEGPRAWIGRPVDRHVQWLLHNDEIHLAEVLEVVDQTDGAHHSQGAGQFYAVSWALVHYLLSAPETQGERIASYFSAVARGEPSRPAFEQAFDLDLADLERDLKRYVREAEFPAAVLTVGPPAAAAGVAAATARPADVLYALGDLLAHMGRETAAERHFHLALDYDPRHAEAHAGLGYVRDRQQRLAEADEYFRQALELGPRSALSFLLYGRHLLARITAGREAGGGDPPELAGDARMAFARAVELDPGYAEAWAMLGYVHLFPGLDAGDGVPYLERARSLQPGRAELVFFLVQLRLRSGRVEEAETLAEQLLARTAEPEMVERAREEIARWRLIQAANEAFREGDLEHGLRLFDEAVSLTSDPDLRAQMEDKLADLRRSAGQRR